VWKFLYDLLNYSPEAFRKYKIKLGDPEVVDVIPLKKMTQVPDTALDVAPSTPAQNTEALDAFFKQAVLEIQKKMPTHRAPTTW